MVVGNVTIDVVHRLARQQLASVDILPDVKMHCTSLSAKGDGGVSVSGESVGGAALGPPEAGSHSLEFCGFRSLGAAGVLYLNDLPPVLYDVTIRCSNPLAACKYLTFDGRFNSVEVLGRPVPSYSGSYALAVGNAVARCIVGSQHGITARSKAIHKIYSNTLQTGRENMFEDDTNLRAQKLYGERLSPVRGDSLDQEVAKLLESVLV